MGFSRQEHWSGLPCPPPGDLPDQALNLGLPHCRQILYCLRNQGSRPYTHAPTLTLSHPLLHPTHSQAPVDAMVSTFPQGPYLSVFLIRMALKMCSRGVFSLSGVGCTKGCRAASEKPCWYSSSSWAGRSRREASLTAEALGSSAAGERGARPIRDPATPTHPHLAPLSPAENLQVTSQSRACPLFNYHLQGNLLIAG